MGADTKSLRMRIRSVDSTLHLTKAMGLVASSKIRRANEAMLKVRGHAARIERAADIAASRPECSKSPYLQDRGRERTRLIIIAGDRGLCGGYNVNVFRLAAEYPGVQIIPIGKRASDRFGGQFISSELFTLAEGYDMARTLCREFKEGKYDRLGIISSRYVSIMTQQAQINWILPLSKKEHTGSEGVIFESDEMSVLEGTVLEYVASAIIAAVRESFACEVAARRMAMDSAGRNAQDMIEKLKIQYNRARQGAITQEITEIVAGSSR